MQRELTVMLPLLLRVLLAVAPLTAAAGQAQDVTLTLHTDQATRDPAPGIGAGGGGPWQGGGPGGRVWGG